MTRPPFPTVLDASLLAAFKSCHQKAYLEYLLHYKPLTPSIHLHAGKAFARGLEVARESFYLHGKSEDDSIADGLRALLISYGSFECPPDSAKSVERTAGAYEYYFTQYPMASDHCVPASLPDGKKGIEFSFAEPIELDHPETGDPLLYVGRMDMMVNYAGALYGEDDKTTSSLGASWSKQWDLRSQFTGYCLLGETEVLTPQGWKRIDSITTTDEVCQWFKDGTMSWAHPNEVHSPQYTGPMITCEGKTAFVSTPDHRQIVFDTYSKCWKNYTSETLPKRSGALRFQSAGRLVGGENWPTAFIQLLVAIQADGSWKDGGVRFHFSKDRKAERLSHILDALYIDYKWHNTPDHSVGFQSPWVEKAAKLLGPDKLWGSWLLELSQENLTTFIEEVGYWDGSIREDRGWMYFTNQKENADWVRTIAAVTGHYSSVHTQEGWKTDNLAYRVNITEGCAHSPHLHEWGVQAHDGQVWCLTVPSSYFLIRYQGRTMITGNCWGAGKAGFPLSGFLVRGVSILKTKYETQQAITYRPQWQIDRWYQQLLVDVQAMIDAWKSGYWSWNLDHACNEYSGCIFRKVCLSANPAPWLATDFERRRWDPVTREEIVLEKDA